VSQVALGWCRAGGKSPAELAQQLGVGAVGLAAPQLALGKAAHLQGVDYAHRPLGLVQGRQQAQPVGAGGLEHTGGPGRQGGQQGRVALRGLGKALDPVRQVRVHVVLADVDSDVVHKKGGGEEMEQQLLAGWLAPSPTIIHAA
jgi:hypothetical protein